MSTDKKEQAKERTRMLVELRKEYAPEVKEAQALLKENQSAQKLLGNAMRENPRSVPQLAEETGLPADKVLWHVATMKKYGLVFETGLDENSEYYLYVLAKEFE